MSFKTRKVRGGELRPNSSWIRYTKEGNPLRRNNNLKSVANTNIRRVQISNTVQGNHVRNNTRKVYKVNKLSNPGNRNIIRNANTNTSYIPTAESVRISPARTPVSSVSEFSLPSRRESFASNMNISSHKIMPSRSFSFQNVPLRHPGITPVVSGISQNAVIPEQRQPIKGNYSFTPGEFGNYSQNKTRNSFLTRTRKTFFPTKPLKTARK